MAASNTPSNAPSGTNTPNPQASRFTTQASTAEDLLQSQTVGLVHLADFRKRRADALEQKEREATDLGLGRFTPGNRSGAATPSDGASTPQPQAKKKRKNPTKGKLSFAVEDDDEESQPHSKIATPLSTPDATRSTSPAAVDSNELATSKKRLGPNASVLVAPKVVTKSALVREAQTREQLRKEFLVMQEIVKATEFLIPFVFYDGTNIPGGVCKVKKGDHAWLFLDRSRKVGAELGVSGGGSSGGGGGGGGTAEKSSNRREWARVGVDDLMLVRGEIIIPHHYEFYYFIVNKTLGPASTPLFPYSAQPTTAALPRSGTSSPAPSSDLSSYDPLARPKKSNNAVTPLDANLEGGNEDPNFTKVVDRRWYERNKHIFPASVWEEFDPTRDYSKAGRRDAEGNAFFFS